MKKPIFLIGLILITNEVHGTNGVGNGGSQAAGEFVNRGHAILRSLRSPIRAGMGLSPEKMNLFQQALVTTRVTSAPGPILDTNGAVVDSKVIDDPIFSGKKLIVLDSQRWEALLKEPNIHRLVFHEYLLVIGEDDSNYRLSSQLRAISGGFDQRYDALPQGRYAGPFQYVNSYDGCVQQLSVQIETTENSLEQIIAKKNSSVLHQAKYRVEFDGRGGVAVYDLETLVLFAAGECNSFQCWMAAPDWLYGETYSFVDDRLTLQGFQVRNAGILESWYAETTAVGY